MTGPQIGDFIHLRPTSCAYGTVIGPQRDEDGRWPVRMLTGEALWVRERDIRVTAP